MIEICLIICSNVFVSLLVVLAHMEYLGCVRFLVPKV
jgi:hypothetical protein